jgi:hypothetical protein
MDKKVERSKNDTKKCIKIGSIAGFVFGLILICCGAIRIHNLNVEVGTKSVEALAAEIQELSEEYVKVEKEKAAEVDENGFSDKYNELAEKSAELNIAITKATNSQYMKETGYNNPRSLGDMLRLAPMLWIGCLVVAASIVALFVFERNGIV